MLNFIYGVGAGIILYYYLLEWREKVDFPFKFVCKEEDCNFSAKTGDFKTYEILQSVHKEGHSHGITK